MGSTLTYFFQRRTSEQAEVSAFQRELRAERMSTYSSYSTAITEFRRGQQALYNLRKEHPDNAMTLTARVEAYRLSGVVQTALSKVQLVAIDPALITAADEAYELTRPLHDAQDSAEVDTRSDKAKEAVDRFVALAAAELQSAPIPGRSRRDATVD